MGRDVQLICRSTDLADSGEGVRFAVVLGGRKEPAFAIRFEGCAYAYLNRCVHARAQLDWIPGAFFDCEDPLLVCSLHGALYAPNTGKCVGGSCRNGALTPLHVEERDGGVYLKDVPKAAVSE